MVFNIETISARYITSEKPTKCSLPDTYYHNQGREHRSASNGSLRMKPKKPISLPSVCEQRPLPDIDGSSRHCRRTQSCLAQKERWLFRGGLIEGRHSLISSVSHNSRIHISSSSSKLKKILPRSSSSGLLRFSAILPVDDPTSVAIAETDGANPSDCSTGLESLDGADACFHGHFSPFLQVPDSAKSGHSYTCLSVQASPRGQ